MTTLILLLLSAQSGPEGNWYLESGNWPEKGQTMKWAVVLSKPWKQVNLAAPGGGIRVRHVRQDDGPWALSIVRGPVSLMHLATPQKLEVGQGGLNIHWGYFLYGHWGGRSSLQQAGPGRIIGRWSYGEEFGGPETWTRSLPRIDRIVFKSDIVSETRPGGPRARVEGKFDSFWWGPQNDMRGNRPRFFVEIYGEHLWGDHRIDVSEAVDLEPLRQNYIQRDKLNTGAFDQVLGLGSTIVIWPKVRAGPKVLRIDGLEIPFDLVIHGKPADKDTLYDSHISPGIADSFAFPSGD